MDVNDNLLRAISWTLAHSIWQGLVLAFLSGIVIVATRKSAAVIRYNIIAVLLFAFLCVSALTFSYQMQSQQLQININLDQLPSQIDGSSHSDSDIISADIVQRLIDLFNANSDIIVLVWFMIFCIRLLKFFLQINDVYKVRNSNVNGVLEFWQEKIITLSNSIHLKQAVILLESTVIKVPSVTGFFKPILLLPVGLLANLPHDQIEAILLHELAHIRRKDYLINIIQSFVEVLFFFNPGLLWVSSILRDERENCCDDIALSATNNRQVFARALLSFEEYKLARHTFSIGFGGSKNHLLHRVKRIFSNTNKNLSSVEKTFISVSLLLILGVFLACSNSTVTNSKSNISKKSKTISTTTTSESVYSSTPNFTDITIADERAKIADAESIIADQKVAIVDADVAKKDVEVARIDAKVAKDDVIVAKNDLRFAKSAAEIELANKRIALAQQQQLQAEDRVIAAEIKFRSARSKLNQPKTTLRNNSLEKTVVDENLKKNISSAEPVAPIILNKDAEENRITKGIIADLLSDKLIANTANLSFSLNNTKLTVNGVSQPTIISSKFIAKYLKTATMAISYQHQSTNKL